MKKIVFLKLIILNSSIHATEYNDRKNKDLGDNITNIDDIKGLSMSNIISEKEKNKENNNNDDDINNNKKNKVKTKFSYKPSFFAVGFDLFSLIYNIISKTSTENGSSDNSYIDCRVKGLMDFNNIIGDISFGYGKMSSKYTENTTEFNESSFFINPNVYFNFLKKNSERNIIYLGGGPNISYNKYTMKKTSDDMYNFEERSIFLWFSIEGGCKTYIIPYLHAGINLKINFLKFNPYNNSNFSDTRKITYQQMIYGFGYNTSSYNAEFSIYLFLNIDLFDDNKVIKRESFI